MHKSKNLKIINIGHLISQAISRTPGDETPNALQQQHAFKRPKGQQKLTEKIKWQTKKIKMQCWSAAQTSVKHLTKIIWKYENIVLSTSDILERMFALKTKSGKNKIKIFFPNEKCM